MYSDCYVYVNPIFRYHFSYSLYIIHCGYLISNFLMKTNGVIFLEILYKITHCGCTDYVLMDF